MRSLKHLIVAPLLAAALHALPLDAAGQVEASDQPSAAETPSPDAPPPDAPPAEAASTEPIVLRVPGTEEIEDPFLRVLVGGRFDLNVRWRFEHADVDGFDDGNALTMRTRLGYTTGRFAGFAGAVQMENNFAADDDAFNAAGLNGQPNRSVIADPEDTELNQLWVDFDARVIRDDLPVSLRAGRQRIILDDARFVGNVGWRQLEQTFDAVRVTGEPTEHLTIDYGYIWDVRRIFGPDADRDYDSDSHFVNARYAGLPIGAVTAFAYLFDLEGGGAPVGATVSSQTYGLRLTGSRPLDDAVDLHYVASAALQSDFADQPVDYEALYLHGELKAMHADSGFNVGVGFEQLGSDDGNIAFSTPLATLHKFNGYADALLATPAGGLRDTYAFIGTRLPEPFDGKVALTGHYFTGDESGGDLGWELDAVATHRINQHLNTLIKLAHFDGDGRADVTRLWVQLELQF